MRWYNSLIARTTLLCVVLLLCLLGSVYVLTNHYFLQIQEEMIAQAESIADDISLHLESSPEQDLDSLGAQFEDGVTEVTLSDQVEQDLPAKVSLTIEPDGTVTKVATTSIRDGDRILGLMIRVSHSPQTEIVRAFRDEYVLAITAVFVVALILVILFIRRTLRPLRELSDTCAQISAGNLKPVEIQQSTGEVLALEHTFNRMVSSLKEKEVVEARLRHAQRLSAIGNLAAGVAHDIRNPLNAIKLLSSHALDVLGDSSGEQRAAKQVNTIRQEVNRLEEIVSGFLSLAKERELQPEMCRADSLVEDCVRLFHKDAEQRGLQLSVELRGGDTELLVDPKHWARAILNILVNALQASPESGRIRIFTRVTDTTYEVEVRDDGPGLSEEAIERAFEPYFTTKPTGTGLGLSITRGIIEEHGGTVELSSSEGQGCQVLITMPLRPWRPLKP